jgi:DNA mismatch repair ATPase MutS
VIRGLAVAFVVAAAAWYVTGLLSPLLLVLTAEACCAYVLKKQLRETISAAENTFTNLDVLAELLAILERQHFSARWLTERMELARSRNLEAARAIGALRTIVQVMESRRNSFVAVLDVPLMISVQAAVAAESWRRTHGKAIAVWLDVVGDFEALGCLATYSYEHPSDPFPEWIEGRPAFRGRQIAHPLLPRAKAVANDVEVDEGTGLLLVSGSNMSGKSTLLRAVGLNTVLAMAGAPVRAKRLEMTPLQVGASIRINDSLREGASRFYAEIVRLRQIFELCGRSPPLLALLDELLQGTNSADRRIGGQGIVRALVHNGAIGLVTTHDLALAAIESRDGTRITNVHFQDEIEDGQMKFDYTLRPGVVTKSNALALMRAVGLEV